MSMTNEQREAVDNIKIFVKSIRSDLAEESEDNQELADALDTVLALIKEQQEEIEGLKDKEVLIKRYFNKCDLIDKKDKQIDLMARAFKQDDVRTVEEIKQYFADLVEKE